VHQLRGVELVRLAGATQRSEQIEPTGLETVLAEAFREGGVGEVCRSEETSENSQRGDVQVGALAAPLRENQVDVIGRMRCQRTKCTS
jgi:hypothetical protein